MIIYLQMIDDPQDRWKFEQLYTKYKDLMYYTACKILRNDRDAEDAVHDAFLAIVKHIEKISAVECPKTRAYVVTIAENKAIDLYRKKQRHPTGELMEETAGLSVEYDGDDELGRCMAKLPARYRQFLLLRYDHDYTVKEVAQMMGLSLSAAYKLEQRAKKALEALCKEAGVL